jgi:uncharacterized protein
VILQVVSACEAKRLKADFEDDWPPYLALDVSEAIWRRAGDLAERHALRGFDSLHLASFLSLVSADLGEPVQFSAFDALERDDDVQKVFYNLS